MSEQKLKFVEIKHYQVFDGDDELLGSYINSIADAGVLMDEINEAETGYWQARIVYMTQEEYDALPEFQGY